MRELASTKRREGNGVAFPKALGHRRFPPVTSVIGARIDLLPRCRESGLGL